MNIQNAVRINFFLLIFTLLADISNSQTPAGNFKLVSSVFEEGKPIPSKYTCDGTNVSPPLRWTGIPEKTKSFAIIMDDPDAPMGNWVHWVVYNIPGTVNNLAEEKNVAGMNASEGINSWEEKGYNGPCPGGTHRYIFKLYALDQTLTVKERITDAELLEAMKGHILAETTLTGLFRTE